MGWITDSGPSLPASTVGCDVRTSKQSASTVLFFKTGQTTIRQRETETITEYRGLDEDSALAKTGVSDGTTQTVYYATLGGDEHSITVTTGTRTEISARRANEANGWIVTKREVEYSVEPNIAANGYSGPWATSLTLTATSEVVVSVEYSASFVFSMDSNVLTSTKQTTVKERRHFSTEALASAAYTAATHGYTEYQCGTNVIKKCVIPSGTQRSVSVFKVSDEEGWTARATETVYGKEGSAWTAV